MLPKSKDDIILSVGPISSKGKALLLLLVVVVVVVIINLIAYI